MPSGSKTYDARGHAAPATLEGILAQCERLLDGQEKIIADVLALKGRMEAIETTLIAIRRDIVPCGR